MSGLLTMLDGQHRPVWLLTSGSLIMIVLLVMFAGRGEARKHAQPMPYKEVAQTWVGLSEDRHYMVRMVFEQDGTGHAAYAFLNEEPRTFTFSWSYEESRGRLEVEPVSLPEPPSWVRSMSGAVIGTMIKLEASGPDWSVVVLLLQEAEMKEKWKALERVMGELPKQ